MLVWALTGTLAAAALWPYAASASEAATSVEYRSVFAGYRPYDAGYEQTDWRSSNAAISDGGHAASHGAMHSAESPEPDVETNQHADTPVPPAEASPESDRTKLPQKSDPHAGHHE